MLASLTPTRIATLCALAASMMRWMSSRLLTLPGFRRIFAAPPSMASMARAGLKWMSATSGHAHLPDDPGEGLRVGPPRHGQPDQLAPRPDQLFDLPHAPVDVRRGNLRHRLDHHGGTGTERHGACMHGCRRSSCNHTQIVACAVEPGKLKCSPVADVAVPSWRKTIGSAARRWPIPRVGSIFLYLVIAAALVYPTWGLVLFLMQPRLLYRPFRDVACGCSRLPASPGSSWRSPAVTTMDSCLPPIDTRRPGHSGWIFRRTTSPKTICAKPRSLSE